MNMQGGFMLDLYIYKKNITLLIGVAIAVGSCMPLILAQDIANGLSLKLELPDGEKWVLGEKGIGRPFLARLYVCNNGEEDVRVWDPANSEGSVSPSVILTNGKTSRQFLLRPLFVNRTTGPATFNVLKPHEVLSINLELLRLVDEQCSPSAGEYLVTARYENSRDHGGQVKNIWTGRITSESKQIQILAP